MSGLLLKNVSKTYPGGQQAVSDFNLEIKEREFLILAGPEGCGKSTLIRMIAGLEEITRGSLFIDGVEVTGAEPRNRNTAMLFKNSVLYPGMPVRENLAFALRMGKVPQSEIDRRTAETAKLLSLGDCLDKMPEELTKTEYFRALMGRALMKRPAILLIDSAVGTLRPEIQKIMCEEFRDIHKKMGMTVIYATDDRETARALGTRMIVMNDGAVCQDGTPAEIYNMPNSVFVASFIGEPSMNLFPAEVTEAEGSAELVFEGGRATLPRKKGAALLEAGYLGKEVVLGVRPEYVHLLPAGKEAGAAYVEAELLDMEAFGNGAILKFRVGDADCAALEDRLPDRETGSVVCMSMDADQLHVFDGVTEKTILNP